MKNTDIITLGQRLGVVKPVIPDEILEVHIKCNESIIDHIHRYRYLKALEYTDIGSAYIYGLDYAIGNDGYCVTMYSISGAIEEFSKIPKDLYFTPEGNIAKWIPNPNGGNWFLEDNTHEHVRVYGEVSINNRGKYKASHPKPMDEEGSDLEIIGYYDNLDEAKMAVSRSNSGHYV